MTELTHLPQIAASWDRKMEGSRQNEKYIDCRR